MKSLDENSKQTEQQVLDVLWGQFQKFSLLNKTIFNRYLEGGTSFLSLLGDKASPYPMVDGSQWSRHKQL
jgi:hypothetical protein